MEPSGPENRHSPDGRRPDRRPNIIFIVVDDLGFGGLGCYGQRLIRTPNVDRLAQEGMRFEQHYAGCSVCAPSRAVLLTGKHAGHTAVRANTGGVPLPESEVTVADILSRAGYTCGGFGKWGLGDTGTPGVPERHGFDMFFGYYHQIHAHDYYPEYLWCNSAKVLLEANENGGRKFYSQHLIFDEMLRWIRANKERPFFCYAPWTPPHGRYEIPEDELAFQEYVDRPWPKTARIYAGMIALIDRQVGELLALLAELGIDRDTIVFFTSDNGAAPADRSELTRLFRSNGGLRGGKRTLYEGGIRVPFIVRWPGHVPASSVSRHVSYFADVLPTLAELAGAPTPEETDGLSLVPTLLGEQAAGRPQEEHARLYWECGGLLEYTLPVPMQAVRFGQWKAVRHRAGDPIEVYDLAADQEEQRNLATLRPDLVAEAKRHFAECHVDPPPQIEPVAAAGREFRRAAAEGEPWSAS